MSSMPFSKGLLCECLSVCASKFLHIDRTITCGRGVDSWNFRNELISGHSLPYAADRQMAQKNISPDHELSDEGRSSVEDATVFPFRTDNNVNARATVKDHPMPRLRASLHEHIDPRRLSTSPATSFCAVSLTETKILQSILPEMLSLPQSICLECHFKVLSCRRMYCQIGTTIVVDFHHQE